MTLKSAKPALAPSTLALALAAWCSAAHAQHGPANPPSIAICHANGGKLAVSVDLNGPNLATGVSTGTPRESVTELFDARGYENPAIYLSALALNANFYVNGRKSPSGYPKYTPIGPIYRNGSLVQFANNAGIYGTPTLVNDMPGAAADTLAIYNSGTDAGMEALAVDASSWSSWASANGGRVSTAVSGIIIESGGLPDYAKAKAAGIYYSDAPSKAKADRQRTALGYDSKHGGILYAFGIRLNKRSGAQISQLPSLMAGIPKQCDPSSTSSIDTIILLDGGASTEMQALSGVQDKSIKQSRTIPAILHFAQTHPAN